jgi:hypothetical protein
MLAKDTNLLHSTAKAKDASKEKRRTPGATEPNSQQWRQENTPLTVILLVTFKVFSLAAKEEHSSMYF